MRYRRELLSTPPGALQAPGSEQLHSGKSRSGDFILFVLLFILYIIMLS